MLGDPERPADRTGRLRLDGLRGRPATASDRTAATVEEGRATIEVLGRIVVDAVAKGLEAFGREAPETAETEATA